MKRSKGHWSNKFAFINIVYVSAKLEGEDFFARHPGLCETIASLCTISCVTSLMTIAMMALNRYFFICAHDWYEKLFTKKKSVVICVSLYSVGTTLVLLNRAGIGDHSFDRKSLECIWDRMAMYPFTIVFSIVLVWIPLTVIGLSYGRIFVFVLQHKRKMKQHSTFSHSMVNSLRLAKTLFVIYAVFTTCWIPYALIMIIDSEDNYPYESHLYITMFAHLHPSLNWLIYYITNKRYRRAYEEILFSCLAKCCNVQMPDLEESTRTKDTSKSKSLDSTDRCLRPKNRQLQVSNEILTQTTNSGQSSLINIHVGDQETTI